MMSYIEQAKLIAWIEMITSVLGFCFVTIPTVSLSLNPDLKQYFLADENSLLATFFHFSLPERVTSVLIPIFYFIGEFILAGMLWTSVTFRNYSNLRTWYVVTITVCMSALYFFLPGVFFTDDSMWFIVIFAGSYAFTAYSVWVVYSILKEMRGEGLHSPIATWDEEEDDKLKL